MKPTSGDRVDPEKPEILAGLLRLPHQGRSRRRMMEKADEQPYYLDAFKRIVAEMLLEEIIPLLARQAENREDRRRWAGEIAFAMVSGVLAKLAKRYPKVVDEFYEQSKRLAKELALEDMRDHPNEYLAERQARWMEKLSNLPPSPKHRRSPNTGRVPLNKLQALVLYEEAVSFVHQLYSERPRIRESKDQSGFDKEISVIMNRLQTKFPELTKGMCKAPAYEIATRYPETVVAHNLSAMVAGIDVESFGKKLQGARKVSAEIDEALKVR